MKINLNTTNLNARHIKGGNYGEKILIEKEYIMQDIEYFKNAIKKMIKMLDGSKKEVDDSNHVAKHPKGMINMAIYDAKTNTITQYNNVSKNNTKGTSSIKYNLD